MWTRRDVLRRAGCGAAAAFGAGGVANRAARGAAGRDIQGATARRVNEWMKQAGGPRGWRISAGLNGFMSSAHEFKKTYPIWEVLHFVRNDGFAGVELVQGWPMGHYPDPDDTRRVTALKDLYDRYNLKIATIQPHAPGRPFAESADERRAWLAAFTKQIALCKRLGGDFIGHWPGGGLGDQTIDQAIDHCIDSYRQAAQRCADAGMWLSFEIEPPFVFNTLDHLKRIVEGVDHPACRTNYDPSHFDVMSGGRGKPEEMLAKLGVRHIGHVHLTDTDGTMFGGTSKHLACGEGHCDIPASLRMLWRGGYRGWIMIDGWKIRDVYDACRKGKRAIEGVLDEVG